MVRGRHDHQGLGIAGRDMECRGQNGRCGVARLGLDQDGARVNARLRKLLGHHEAEVRAGDDHRPTEARPREPPGRGREKAVLSEDRRELLGVSLARQRPEPRARASTEKDLRDHDDEFSILVREGLRQAPACPQAFGEACQ